MIKDLEKVVENAWEGSPNGGAHKFINLGDGMGLKVYRYGADNDTDGPYKRERLVKAFELQKLAAEIGLAPQVGELVEFQLGNQKYFGYTTQVADIVPHSLSKPDPSYPDFQTFETAEYKEFEERHREHVEYTVHQLERHLGFHVWDDKAMNFSFIDGQHVLLDFGEEGYTERDNFVLKDRDFSV